MNKILSFIDAKCPQNIYKSIISDIEKIERQFEIMQTNKFKNLKLKEQFRLLLNMLQSPNSNVNIEKTTNQINTILNYFRNVANNNLSDLEVDIKKLCIKIGSFMTNFKIREKRDELMKLKKKELELIEILMELIDNEVQKNDQNTDPLSKVVLQKNVKNLQGILSEIKDENDSHILTKVNDIVKNIDFDSIENIQNIDQKISTLKSKIHQLDEYEQEKQEINQQMKEQRTVPKKGTQKINVQNEILEKIKLIDDKSKSKNTSKVNVGQQTRNQLQQVDNMKDKFQSEISNKSGNLSLNKLLEKRRKNKENIRNQKQNIQDSLDDITNEDKKLRINQMAKRARDNITNEISDAEIFDDLLSKTPPYSKKLVNKDSFNKFMKKVEKDLRPQKSGDNRQESKKSGDNRQESKKSGDNRQESNQSKLKKSKKHR